MIVFTINKRIDREHTVLWRMFEILVLLLVFICLSCLTIFYLQFGYTHRNTSRMKKATTTGSEDDNYLLLAKTDYVVERVQVFYFDL